MRQTKTELYEWDSEGNRRNRRGYGVLAEDKTKGGMECLRSAVTTHWRRPCRSPTGECGDTPVAFQVWAGQGCTPQGSGWVEAAVPGPLSLLPATPVHSRPAQERTTRKVSQGKPMPSNSVMLLLSKWSVVKRNAWLKNSINGKDKHKLLKMIDNNIENINKG